MVDTNLLNKPWAEVPRPPVLGPGEVHIWRLQLALCPTRLATLAGLLSEDEQARARRFRFARHRDRFTAGRGQLREILALYVGESPGSIRFCCSAAGKPALSRLASREEANSSSKGIDVHGPYFNLSHSEDIGLLAITNIGPIGVDLEQVREMRDAPELVNRFFSARESREYHLLPEGDRARAFFNLWTRKEAWLKATGEGIAYSLNKVEVSFLPETPARLIALPAGASVAEWYMEELNPAANFVAALIVRGQPSAVECMSWLHEM